MKIRQFFLTIGAIFGCAAFLTSCGPAAKRGAVIGGLGGAAVGTIIGNQSGRPLEGAAVGGAIGAGAGSLLGGARDDERRAYRGGYQDRGYDRGPYGGSGYYNDGRGRY